MYRYDASNYDANTWDDTDLIRAYDAALNSFEKKCKLGTDGKTNTGGGGGQKFKSASARKSQSNSNRSNGGSRKSSRSDNGAIGGGGGGLGNGNGVEDKVLVWNVGDRCCAYYTEDGELYPAEVISIKGNTCYIRYMDYGNKEEQNLCDLRPFEDYHYYDTDISLDGASDLNINEPILSAPPKSMLINSSSNGNHNVMPAYPTPARNYANNPGPPAVPVSFLNHGANSEINVDNRGGGLNQPAGMPSNLNIPADNYSGFGPPVGGVGMHDGGPASHVPPHPNQQTGPGGGGNSCLVEELMNGIPLIPPPPPINASSVTNDQALNAMLMSWYMVGYHSGYYLGLQHGLTSAQVSSAAQSHQANLPVKNFQNNPAPSTNAHTNPQSSVGQQQQNPNIPSLPIHDFDGGSVFQMTDRKSNKQPLNGPHQVPGSVVGMQTPIGMASVVSLSSPHQISSQVPQSASSLVSSSTQVTSSDATTYTVPLPESGRVVNSGDNSTGGVVRRFHTNSSAAIDTNNLP